MRIHKHEYQIKTKDGLILFMRSWIGNSKPRAVIALVHGYGEHCGRYDWFARHLAGLGYAVYGFDHRGHGRSEGLRAYVSDYRLLLDDVNRFVAKVYRRHPDARLFLLGQSMGGALLANFVVAAADPPWEITWPLGYLGGVVLCSPALRVERAGFLNRLFAGLGSFIIPKWSIPAFAYSLEIKGLAHDPKVIEDYRRDPFVYQGRLRFRTGWELLRGTKMIAKRGPEIRLAILLLHGTADIVTDPEGTRHLHETCTAEDKTLILYPDGYHELLQDRDREAVMGDIVAWLSQRLA